MKSGSTQNQTFEIKLRNKEFSVDSIENIENLTQFIMDNTSGEIILDLSGLNMFKAIKCGTLIATKVFIASPTSKFKVIVDNDEVFSNLKVLDLGNASIELKNNSYIKSINA